MNIEMSIVSADRRFVSFRLPPLIEVSFGIQFEPLDRLRIPHIGLFWDRVRKDFPLVEHAQPVLSKDQIFRPDPATGLPLPRIWLIDQTDTRLIQLQADRYNFNWRFREGVGSYPRFPEIADAFFRYRDVLDKFLADADIGLIEPVHAELTYINAFVQGREWSSPDDLPNVFRDFLWRHSDDRFLPRPKTLTWGAVFSLPEDRGTLNAKLGNAKRVIDDQPVLQLELAATCPVRGQSREAIKSWYELAHEWIVKGFVDLTQQEMQQTHWGREQ